MHYRNKSRCLYNGRWNSSVVSCLKKETASGTQNTDHELHDINTKVFLYHGTDSDASSPEPVQELGIKRIDNELDVVLQNTRSIEHTQGTGGKLNDT